MMSVFHMFFHSNNFSVFWDLYCAAPERRDTPNCDYSNEAKAFHDYVYHFSLSLKIIIIVDICLFIYLNFIYNNIYMLTGLYSQLSSQWLWSCMVYSLYLLFFYFQY